MSQVIGPIRTSSHMIKVSHFDTFVMQQKGYVTCASDGRTLLKYCIDAAGRRTRIIQEKSTSKQITTSDPLQCIGQHSTLLLVVAKIMLFWLRTAAKNNIESLGV